MAPPLTSIGARARARARAMTRVMVRVGVRIKVKVRCRIYSSDGEEFGTSIAIGHF